MIKPLRLLVGMAVATLTPQASHANPTASAARENSTQVTPPKKHTHARPSLHSLFSTSCLVALDTETGGFNSKKDGLISIGAINSKGEKFEGIICPNPNLGYHAKALQVNGFTKNNQGWKKRNTQTGQLDPINCQTESEVLLGLIDFLKACGPETPLVGCSTNFDLRFLLEAAARQGLSHALTTALNRPTADLRVLAKEAHKKGLIQLPTQLKTGKPKVSLDTIAHSTKLHRNPHQFHDGLEDATLTLQATAALVRLAEPPKTNPTCSAGKASEKL